MVSTTKTTDKSNTTTTSTKSSSDEGDKKSTTSSTYNEFIHQHRNQLLDQLQIPEPLLQGIHDRLVTTYRIVEIDNNKTWDIQHATQSVQEELLFLSQPGSCFTEYGAIIVVPHLVSWDMKCGRGTIEALRNTDSCTLQFIWEGLQQLQMIKIRHIDSDAKGSIVMNGENDTNDKMNLVNAIADHPMLWSRVVLYRCRNGTVRGTIPSPPYLPHVIASIPAMSVNNSNNDSSPNNSHRSTVNTSTDCMDDMEADCTGPFPFRYHHPMLDNRAIDLSLLYVSPEGVTKMKEASLQQGRNYLPTIDIVPSYQYPNDCHMRTLRYAAFSLHDPNEAQLHSTHHNNDAFMYLKERYADFIRQMHLVRQLQMQDRQQQEQQILSNIESTSDESIERITRNSTPPILPMARKSRVYNVFTDSNDPMELKHPIAGLEANSTYFKMVDDVAEADVIYSYQSVFSPSHPFYAYIQQESNNHVMINQFPYEGAMVQKDHLAREILKQHGLPRPAWALETYDLDVHMTELVGSVLFAVDELKHLSESSLQFPLWIVKPALGTQSQGHVVTRNLAHIIRLNDAVGGRRVAQRYIERPVCIDKRKVDCRIVVLMTSAGQVNANGQVISLPTLHMHKTCYFRIANKPHIIDTASDRADHESVLTASHLLKLDHRTSMAELRKLPTHADTIQKLEHDYPNSFDWEKSILPQIQIMIRELFNGMTTAYPQMSVSQQSRAVYGIDVMFQVDTDVDLENNEERTIVTPKLTEVTFCPANNAVCEAYVRDENLYRSYNKDIFECLFLGIVSPNIIQLQ
jgi:hypothetical protein